MNRGPLSFPAGTLRARSTAACTKHSKICMSRALAVSASGCHCTPTQNHEGSVHALYGYIYVTDREEGLILVPAATLLDGNPLNNFLGRELTYNPGGILNGARAITIVGTYAYIACDAGLVVVKLEDPKNPSVTARSPTPQPFRERSDGLLSPLQAPDL